MAAKVQKSVMGLSVSDRRESTPIRSEVQSPISIMEQGDWGLKAFGVRPDIGFQSQTPRAVLEHESRLAR
jgi:hypothetical protein